MQSKIRIEYDFDTKQPVLRFTQAFESDDLRDTMLKAFIQKATNTNSTLYFTFPEFSDRRDNSITELRCEENAPSKTLMEGLLSKFQIGDEADYTTPEWADEAFKAQKKKSPDIADDEIEYTPKYATGKVVAVRFTESKVWYDMLDSATGKVVRDIPSHYVKRFGGILE